jgi:hypothetical protein
MLSLVPSSSEIQAQAAVPDDRQEVVKNTSVFPTNLPLEDTSSDIVVDSEVDTKHLQNSDRGIEQGRRLW